MYTPSKVAPETVLIRGNFSVTDTTVMCAWFLFDFATE